MDQVNYKGYARSIGFDPIKAPTAALQRMQEHDARIIRGMEDNRRAIKQVRDEYGAGLERKFSQEKSNRDQNYALQKQAREVRKEAIRTNAQTQIQSELNRGKTAEATFQSLAKFSTTIADTLTEYKKAKDESDMLDGYMEAAAGLPEQRLQAQQQGETVLQVAGERQDQVAEGFQQRGAPPEVVMNLLSGNKARDYGRLKFYTEMAVADFPGWARERLDEMGAMTAADRTAAMRGLFGEYLQSQGLFGLKADFMAEGLMKMRGSYNSLIEDARKSDIISRSENMRDETLENLFRSKSGESFNEAFRSIARTYNEDGRTPVGMAKARQMLFKELSDTTRYTDTDVERILGEAMTDNGQSFKERFGRDYDDLIKNRALDNEAEFKIRDAQESRQQKQAEKELLAWVDENWNGSRDTLQEIIKEAEINGIPTDRLKAHLARSNEQQNIDFWTRQFTEAYDQGTLTTDDTDQPGVPWEVRQEFRKRAEEQERMRGEAGIKQDTIKQEFLDLAKSKLVGESTSRAPHHSSRAAADYALRLFNSKFKQYSKTMEPSTAAEQARNDVIAAMNKGEGKFKVIGSADAAGTQAFFGAFNPGNHPGAPQPLDIIDASSVIRQVRTNPALIDQKVITSPALLKDIDNRIASGKPISIPQIYADLAKPLGRTPVDILNAQLQAAGLTQRVKPGFREQLSQIQDPKLRAILDQPLTQERLNTAIIGSGNAPATIRTGGQGFTDVVSLGTAAGFKFPQAMAAMWALESGYGKYHSNPNNVFNIKDRRTGQFKTYASPLESAKDFMYLMTDQKYAPALAAATTPRQFIEGIAMTYSGQERDYASKIIRVMKDNGINPDQPFNNNPNPARNNGYMRPTLAYISGNIGPTSTGAHLDVKQQDNPNTKKNEFAQVFAVDALDQFVVVDDRELGRVPLSRTPITNTFAQHQARGSHGIDYGLYSGTKIYVQNGARVISKQRTQHGDKVVIQLPDGRRFSFLHGNSV
ncbi:hypothetical protein S-CBP1_0035 [Synechococcus phage S-CBP1]|uniref:Mannosyl-glycoprotein endo-beta-N-acetylglucosamidase-like domain-containing protein n=1 Tax=Synechococcus phage S-CBP1 TaxID=1273711 RepID=A0A096VKG5_9CAUD|nr:hypothetical protein S-CBP1_0035 [Synechococcus phage S-CBP1]AGK86540.1 hypothetical protein S-CBP1_0035 [Synechococcus phage S-CBP1]